MEYHMTMAIQLCQMTVHQMTELIQENKWSFNGEDWRTIAECRKSILTDIETIMKIDKEGLDHGRPDPFTP